MLIKRTIENNSSKRLLKSKLAMEKIFKLHNKIGEITSNKTEILDAAKNIYKELYQTRKPRSNQVLVNIKNTSTKN